MSDTGNRLTASLEGHPRLIGVLFALMVLLVQGVTLAAAGGGSTATSGP